MSNREELIRSLTLYHLIIKVKSSMDQFVDGLEDVGLLQLIRKNPEVWKAIFVRKGVSLTAGKIVFLQQCCRFHAKFYADAFKALFDVHFAEEGSTV